MATEVDATIAKVLDQGFANMAQGFGQSAVRFNAGSELTANEAARMFQLETQLVGALAAARLDKSATADKVLELRSTQGQPQARADGGQPN